MRLLAAMGVLCLTASLLVTGVAAATFAEWAVFLLSPKGLLLFAAALVLLIGQAKLLNILLRYSNLQKSKDPNRY